MKPWDERQCCYKRNLGISNDVSVEGKWWDLRCQKGLMKMAMR